MTTPKPSSGTSTLRNAANRCNVDKSYILAGRQRLIRTRRPLILYNTATLLQRLTQKRSAIGALRLLLEKREGTQITLAGRPEHTVAATFAWRAR